MEERVAKDQTVIVTGGATGIGYSIADNFLKNGAQIVIILDINQEEGEKTAATFNTKYGKGRAASIKCDVTQDLNEVAQKLTDTYGTIDVLVNNAGVMVEKDPKTTININLTAVIEWSFRYFNHMRKDKGGKGGTIINISSIYGFTIAPFVPVYQATKFGVFGFTKSLGHKSTYDKTGVRVVALCPGFTAETNLGGHLEFFDDEILDEYFQKQLATVQWQKPEVVGAAAAEVFQRADSGSAWMISSSEPISEIVLTNA